MGSVFVVGTVVKDVYLQLDGRLNNFEYDKDQIPWLDVGFDGRTYPFFRRTSVLGGAAVTLEVLENFGLDAKITGCDISFKNKTVDLANQIVQDYRYILNYDNHIAYLTGSEHERTDWVEPSEGTEWILVDRSAKITADLATNIKNFLDAHPNIQLAVFLPENANTMTTDLAGRAALIFEESFQELKEKRMEETDSRLCRIAGQGIYFGGEKIRWRSNKIDLMTHLTLHSIAAATILGAKIRGLNEREALVLAKTNLENATLDGTLPFDKLNRLAEKVRYATKDLRFMAATLAGKGENEVRQVANIEISPTDLVNEKLFERLQEGFTNGLRFARCGASVEMDELATLGQVNLGKELNVLAMQAKACQENDMVPIIRLKLIYGVVRDVNQYLQGFKKLINDLIKELVEAEADIKACILELEKAGEASGYSAFSLASSGLAPLSAGVSVAGASSPSTASSAPSSGSSSATSRAAASTAGS